MNIKLKLNYKKLFVLLNLILFLISSHALINAPGPFEWAIVENLKIDTYQYGILVSLCSWASLLDVVHGYLLDRYLGLILATWIYSTILSIGCVLYSIAGFTRDYRLMIVGRIIYGLGLNPMLLLGYKHIIRWFGSGKYVNFIYSLTESNSWFGACIIYLVTHPVLDLLNKVVSKEESFAITNAGEIGFFTIFTIIPLMIIAYMFKCKDNDDSEIKDVPTFVQTEENTSVKSDLPNGVVNHSDQQKKVLTFKDYVFMPLEFWLLSISAFLYYVNILSFISLSVLFFKTRYHLTPNQASLLSGLISLAPASVTPFSGLALDKIGHNLTSFTIGILLNVVSFGLLNWTSLSPVLPIIAMGLSLIATTGIWSQFQFLVEDHQYMIAYGVAQTGLNTAQAVGTIIAGNVIDKYGYPGFMTFQFTVITSAVPVIALVWLLDLRRGNFLNLTSQKKNEVLGRFS